MNVAADAALPPVTIDVGVNQIIRVTLRAVRFCVVYRAKSNSAHDVLDQGSGFNMERAYAGAMGTSSAAPTGDVSIVTDMIEVESLRNGADKQFVNQAVSGAATVVEVDAPVAISLDFATPLPATTGQGVNFGRDYQRKVKIETHQVPRFLGAMRPDGYLRRGRTLL